MIELRIISNDDDAKKASEQLSTLWGQAIVDQKSGEFEKEWDMTSELPTEERRRSRSRSRSTRSCGE